jgi:hypothetical protein
VTVPFALSVALPPSLFWSATLSAETIWPIVCVVTS